MELVTGATGYVGGRLIRLLVRDRAAVRALARDPWRLEPIEGVEVAKGDLLSGEGLAEALEGCSTAYYLVHSMEAVERPADGTRPHRSGRDFRGRDRSAAEHFAAAARAAGVERIVYLGGLAPAGTTSQHLDSRLEVEEVLLEAVPRSTALRASIVIGAGSASFRVLVRLIERLRVLPLPAWRLNRTRPIDERDVLEFLVRTPQTPAAAGRSLDVVGPDVLSYGEMIDRIAELMGVGRLALPLPASLTPPASAVVSALADQPLELVRPLMESLEFDLLPRDSHEAAPIYGVRTRPFDRAVERALAEWESLDPLGAR